MLGQDRYYGELLSDAISMTNQCLDSFKINGFIYRSTLEDERGNASLPNNILHRIWCYRITRIERGYYRTQYDYKLPSLIGNDIITNAPTELIKLTHKSCSIRGGFFSVDARFSVPYFEKFTYIKCENNGREKKDYRAFKSLSYHMLDNVAAAQMLQNIYMDQQREKEIQLRRENEKKQRAQDNARLESELESMLKRIQNRE
ncbi:MAG: hypothetical protein IKW00_07595 [Clostridia bacterium]|nr:hypothetical protein [Clostridia bacterium]